MNLTTDPVPNQEAAAMIAGKSVVTRAVFDQLLPELQADAFTITGIEAVDVLQRIRDNIASLPLGADWDAVKDSILEDLGPWFDNPDSAARRAELLLRLHGFRAYSAMNHRLTEAHADAFPFSQYVCTLDGRERATHAALHGKVLPTNHPWWETHTGPWEWGCRCEKVPITADEAEEMRGEDAAGDPANARVIEGAQLQRLETTGRIYTGRPDPRGGHARGAVQEYDVRTPKERGDSDFEWRAGDTGLTIDEIRGRYDPAVFDIWEKWAKAEKMPDGRTVWAGVVEKSPPGPRQPPPAPAALQIPTVRSAPVSAAFGTVDQTIKPVVETALQNIDAVHDDGTMQTSVVAAEPGTTGGYGIRTYRISVGENSKVQLSQFTHEAGHKLDYEALRAARRADPQTEKLWKSVLRTIGGTDAVKELKKNKSPYVTRYLLDKDELWARAYDQWIAEETGHTGHLAQIALRRSGTIGYLKDSQWETADFAKVKRSIRKLFTHLNYLP